MMIIFEEVGGEHQAPDDYTSLNSGHHNVHNYNRYNETRTFASINVSRNGFFIESYGIYLFIILILFMSELRINI